MLAASPSQAQIPEESMISYREAVVFKVSDRKPRYSLAKVLEGDPPPGTVKKSRKGLDRRLVRLLAQIEGHFGRPVIISSGCRSHKYNRRIGGARHSFHLRCMAADIKVSGVSESRLLRFVARMPGRGGVGTYCRNSIVHVDVGPRRNWHQGCGKRSYRYAKAAKRWGKHAFAAKRKFKRGKGVKHHRQFAPSVSTRALASMCRCPSLRQTSHISPQGLTKHQSALPARNERV
jgi:hypothetical protein